MGQNFTDLHVWKEGYDLLMEVYELTAHYPSDERYSLCRDTTRSANSIIANIAESHGRFYFKDKIRVLYISRGEVEETQSHLIVAKGRKYANDNQIDQLVAKYQRLIVGINNMISDYSKKVATLKSH